ncbi:class I SAM-dependent methyltransferase [Mycoplasmopsis glycophila]|uniref:N5-glutamine S-adenosyl-L-methionine-dependent methyltransferase n=1 Tax=Mycoplasmopsis glycophila TaxID=171285 RepID=A0A449AWJ3_9BACT|nr:class I SAM-dependent methyltransferase [Mycoplasmopsis glycophila]VEU71114.1 N5-glutamine S-adenosyl-L-methionine-dependent methyltransferase [Mycoplasmopsis glycophila]
MKNTKKFIAAYNTEKSLLHYGHAIYNVGILQAEHKILEMLNLPKDAKIADLGSGPGRFGINLGLLMPNYQIDCYDLSELSIDLGRKLAKEHKLQKRVKFICGDLTSFGLYGKNKYDLMFFTFNALMTIPDHHNKVLALQNAYKSLKENGFLAFTAPTISGDRNREKYFSQIKKSENERLGDLTYQVENELGILCYYEIEEIMDLLKEAGLPKPTFYDYRDNIAEETLQAKEFSDNAVYYLIEKTSAKD